MRTKGIANANAFAAWLEGIENDLVQPTRRWTFSNVLQGLTLPARCFIIFEAPSAIKADITERMKTESTTLKSSSPFPL